MRILKIFLLVSAFLVTSYAQEKINKVLTLSHPFNISNHQFSYNPKQYKLNADTIQLIAVLVQFQEDDDPLTTGNGRFDLSNKYYDPSRQRDTVIDAPPYDSLYFIDHLKFLKNYYYKASKGKLIINYKLYGKVITLPKKMREYSPLKNESYIKLGYLFQDCWSRADSIINFSNLDSNKTAFIIFHAGIGRDVDLTSIYGYDPTPYDIPSIYIGIKNLKEFFGNNYNGYETQEGFFIKNSLIIPSAELRELNLISGKYLLELGMNGILVGSFGSYLGLPDLFNTSTGKTAIGRFGLMDGQSIFSFNGIFPPEPSAWEKIYLGWINPITISSGENTYTINTSSLPTPQDSTIYKVLINTQEYFLIENRNRNPFNIGQRVYTRNRNFLDSTLYTKDQSGFINYDITKIDGNVIDVSYLDWSLPGIINDTANFRGGILIWHIDETIIKEKFASNTINNDIEHKGVDLEEAKGAQEIGVTYITPFGNVTGDGSFVDFWYNGNHYVPATIYQNKFTPFSIPNSLSYSLANNNIYITDFDTISPVMKFKIRVGSDIIKPITGFPKYIGPPNKFSNPISFDINGDNKDEILVNSNFGIHIFKNNGSLITNDSTGLIINNYSFSPPTFAYSSNLNSNRLIALSNTLTGGKLGLFRFNSNFQIIDSLTIIPISGVNFTGLPLVFDSVKIILPLNQKLFSYQLDGNPSGITDSTINSITQLSKVSKTSFIFSTNNYFITSGNITSKTASDSLISFNQNTFLNGKLILEKYSLSKITTPPILSDINKDTKQEIIINDNGKIKAFTGNEVIVDYFPARVKSEISSGTIVGDINNDGFIDLLFISKEGDLYAYGSNGKILDGFPIKTGKSDSIYPAFFNYSDTLGILVYSNDGYLYAYKTGYPYIENNILWKNIHNDKYLSNSNFKSLSSIITYKEKLPSDRAYNWPNPVYDNKTYIRYFINGNASRVTIKILDLSGELVTKLNGTAYSNTDNEIVWDVSNVQSGIYYGVIEAEIDGTTETKIIKIAVVK
ncbi:MAG: hypothetical protein N2490_07860 [Ignavibacteria bacterium]|nr:hypothetical protein [Ignavibacteria bacterium]